MNKLRSVVIVISIFSLLLLGMQGSQAASITYMSVYSPNDWGNGSNVTVSLGTDEDILFIDWYINGGYEGSTIYGEGTRTATVNFTLTGNIKGEKYKVRATVSFVESSDEDGSRTFWVYRPKSISGIKQPSWEKPRVTGVYGYVELSRHYHDGQNIVVTGYAYACNGTDETCRAISWFRHTEYDENLFPTGWEEQDPPFDDPTPPTPMGPGTTYTNSGSSAISYYVGGPIEDEQVIVLNGHIHLEVSGNGAQDVWHETDHAWTHWFTSADNQ